MMTQHEDFESSPDAYTVKLDAFEGPLDLLLFLIRKNEVNIYDIPISLITEQYLRYIDADAGAEPRRGGRVPGDGGHAHPHQVEDAAAAARDRRTTTTADEEDPREALVRRLLEHQKYRAAAELLHERELLRGAQHMRPDERVAAVAGDDYEPELEVDLFSLMAAFRGVLERASRKPRMVIPPEQISIEDRMRAAAVAAVGDRGLRLRGAVRGRRRLEAVPDRHVPGAAGDDPAEAGARVPGRRRRRDPDLQAGAPADAPHPIGDPQYVRAAVLRRLRDDE